MAVPLGAPAARAPQHDAAAPPGALLRRPVWLWPLLPATTLFLVCLAVSLRAAMRGTDGHLIYSLDDAYIHMAVAKNLARHGLWGCTPFHFSSSSSSLLWTLLLGTAYRAFGVHDLTPLVLNGALVLASLVVADRYLARFGAAPLLRAAALVGLVVAFPMAAMVLMGMEHILHLLLTLWFAGAAAVALTGRPEGPHAPLRRTATLCLLAAALGASRYEGFFLVALACLGFLFRGQVARGAAVAAAALAPAVAFGVVSVANGGFFLPNSLILKAAGDRASALSALFKPWGSEELEFLRNDPPLLVLVALGALGALWQWRRRRAFWRAQLLLPLLLLAMIAAHGHYVFSPMYWVYRYDAYLVGFGVFVAAVLLADLPASGSLVRRALPALLVVPLVVAVADVREGLTAAAEIAGTRNTYLEQYQTALFIRNYHPDEAVIVNDLGAVTYYTESRILDLAALGDIEPLEIMRRTGGYGSRDVVAWTAKYRPRIAILSLGWSWVAPLTPKEWIKVGEVEVPPKRERVGFFAIDPREAWVLRATMAAHFAPLRQVPGYVVKLRSPEKLRALTRGTRVSADPTSF